MKKLLFLTLLILCNNAIATLGVQLGTGGLTPHFTSSKKNYCNQWNNTGIIANKSYYLRFLFGTMGITYMQGNDSICSEVEGLFLHYIMSSSEYLDIGVTFGGYSYNEKNWIEHEKKTPSDITAPSPVSAKYYGRAVVPVLALDVGIHLIRKERWSLKLNNLLTPIITNHSIAFEYRFD